MDSAEYAVYDSILTVMDGSDRLNVMVTDEVICEAEPINQFEIDSGCGNKTTCGEMDSCEEAVFYLEQCGIASLDGDGDGTPCESLCR